MSITNIRFDTDKPLTMDLLRDYASFKDEITYAFKDLIEEFNLKLLEPYEGTILLNGTKCTLKFSYDRGDIGCAFKQHIEANNQYMVSSVYKFLYPEQVYTEGNEQENAWDSKVQLSRYSKIINAKLKNILNGDFSWINEYLKKDKRNGQLSLFVLGLGSEHPITKKFFGGDRSWESDAEQYIALNNIILPDNKWNN